MRGRLVVARRCRRSAIGVAVGPGAAHGRAGQGGTVGDRACGRRCCDHLGRACACGAAWSAARGGRAVGVSRRQGRAGEDERAALVRECREELGAGIVVGGRLGPDLVLANGWVLRLYLAGLEPGAEPVAGEHRAIRWLPADRLATWTGCRRTGSCCPDWPSPCACRTTPTPMPPSRLGPDVEVSRPVPAAARVSGSCA